MPNRISGLARIALACAALVASAATLTPRASAQWTSFGPGRSSTVRRVLGATSLGVTYGFGSWMELSLATGHSDRAPMLGLTHPASLSVGIALGVGGAALGAVLADSPGRMLMLGIASGAGSMLGMSIGVFGGLFDYLACDQDAGACERKAGRFFFGAFGASLLLGALVGTIGALLMPSGSLPSPATSRVVPTADGLAVKF